MALALEAAASADHRTSPNPMVGAVLARGGRVLASAHHRRRGEAHAEVLAIQAAGGAAAGADLFVTLEPCTVQGRTPPCVEAVVASRPRRVVVAMLDPNPAVNGAGVTALRAAGIPVEVGLGEARARRLNEFYVKRMSTGLPFVTAKFAASVDGRIATRTGDSRWISSAESRRRAHHLRHIHDAVLVGATTVVRDDPALTVRLDGDHRQPLRVVLDSTLRVPGSARLLHEPGGAVVVLTGARAEPSRADQLRAAGAEVIAVGESPTGRVDALEALRVLARMEVLSVLVEGGAEVLGSFVDARAIDRVIAFLAPTVIGGAAAVAAVGGTGTATVAEALRLRDLEVELLGGDVLVSGYC